MQINTDSLIYIDFCLGKKEQTIPQIILKTSIISLNSIISRTSNNIRTKFS